MTSKEEQARIKWKDNHAQKHYGMSYAALCCDRKRVVDQMFICFQMDEEEKINSKKRGCR
jgi:hypothetical protein